MTDAQLKVLLEVLMSCYWAGREDANKEELWGDTDEDLQRRAKAAVTKALGVLGILDTADHTLPRSQCRPCMEADIGMEADSKRNEKTVSGAGADDNTKWKDDAHAEVDIDPATGKFIGKPRYS